MKCPLCGSEEYMPFGSIQDRKYFCCGNCELVHVPAEYQLSLAAEKQRYSLHDNSMTNQGYVNYLSGIADAAMPYVNPNSRVLDFGCGKEAVLTALLRNRGIECTPYDPLYNLVLSAESGRYHLVIMCEVIEHCRNLAEVCGLLQKHLLPGGSVLIKTQLYPSCDNIDTWWYAADPTHIMLFSEKSIEEFAEGLNGKLESRLAKDLFIIRKD